MLCFVTITAFSSADDCQVVAIEMHKQLRKRVLSKEKHHLVGISLVILLI